MGIGFFNFIAQACQSLAATAAPSITAMGVHIVIALATIVLVWFGVQEALASAHGGPGFSMGRFLNLFMLLTFAYAMVNYYDSFDPRTWLFHQGLYRRRNNKSSEPDWRRWLNFDAERDPHGIRQDRAINPEQHDESVLRHRVLCGPIPD